MTALAVVQARMGSTRLPGKVLADVEGRPMLAFMLERLAGLSVDRLIVATSSAPADDPVAALADRLGVSCVRGPEHDVLERFAIALATYPANIVVRLTGDCPLVDPDVVADAIALQRRTGAAYVSNTLVRTFPDGLDVEVLTAEALRAAAAEATESDEHEHVTPFVYRRPQRFRLATLRTDLLAGDERWTVDTAEDLDFVRDVARRFEGKAGFSWLPLLECVGRRAVYPPGSLHLRPATVGDRDRILVWRNEPDAVRFSGSGLPVDAAAHHHWFEQCLADPASRLWMGIVDQCAVGQVRVDITDGRGQVSIAVAPEYRGRGYATTMLVALQQALRADLQTTELLADIHPDNAASVSAFRRAQFEPVASNGDFLRYRWVR